MSVLTRSVTGPALLPAVFPAAQGSGKHPCVAGVPAGRYYCAVDRRGPGAARAGGGGGDLVRLETEPAEKALDALVLEEGQYFNPLQEVDDMQLMELGDWEMQGDRSQARYRYHPDAEKGINDAINVAYNMFYTFSAFHAFFDRDDVALLNVAEYFHNRSHEEYDAASEMMRYQNLRGGCVVLKELVQPPSELDHPEKGDALFAFELAVALEKVQNEKYLSLQKIALEVGDPQLEDYVKSTFLEKQVQQLRKDADYVKQLRRVGKGYGVWHFDQELGEEGAEGVGGTTEA